MEQNEKGSLESAAAVGKRVVSQSRVLERFSGRTFRTVLLCPPAQFVIRFSRMNHLVKKREFRQVPRENLIACRALQLTALPPSEAPIGYCIGRAFSKGLKNCIYARPLLSLCD